MSTTWTHPPSTSKSLKSDFGITVPSLRSLEDAETPAPRPYLNSHLRCSTYAGSFSQFNIRAVRLGPVCWTDVQMMQMFQAACFCQKKKKKTAAGSRNTTLFSYIFSSVKHLYIFFPFSYFYKWVGFLSQKDTGHLPHLDQDSVAVKAGWVWENSILAWLATRSLSLSN